ncbi:MAG: single-stranded DNA-binding protein [bacterium]|nr:single-stranded DNA-binding protein [bacterium]
MDLMRVQRRLVKAIDSLTFAAPVTHVYNPLVYAKRPAQAYIERFAKKNVEALFLGMNPGPFGMAQTGVPFGEVAAVRDWMGIEAPVGHPPDEHPKRPIAGFDCTRSEVSGARLWGWARERFGEPEAFFERFFVWNYCPLVFLEDTGRNRTPDKLPAHEREPLFEHCDDALRALVAAIEPERVIGVGKFAETRAAKTLGPDGPPIATILHPSPASPVANRGWAPQAEAQLEALGISLNQGLPKKARRSASGRQ